MNTKKRGITGNIKKDSIIVDARRSFFKKRMYQLESQNQEIGAVRASSSIK
jgi:hypothetical protein